MLAGCMAAFKQELGRARPRACLSAARHAWMHACFEASLLNLSSNWISVNKKRHSSYVRTCVRVCVYVWTRLVYKYIYILHVRTRISIMNLRRGEVNIGHSWRGGEIKQEIQKLIDIGHTYVQTDRDLSRFELRRQGQQPADPNYLTQECNYVRAIKAPLEPRG